MYIYKYQYHGRKGEETVITGLRSPADTQSQPYHSLIAGMTMGVGPLVGKAPTPCPDHRGGGTRGKRPAGTQTGQSCPAPRVPPHILPRRHRRQPGPAPSQGGAPGDGAGRPALAPPGPCSGPVLPSVIKIRQFKHLPTKSK
jgi:hypothetical protein